MSPRSLFRSMFFLVLVVLIIQPLAPALGLTASSAPSKGVLEKPRPAAPSQAALVPRGELTALRFASRSGTARRMSCRPGPATCAIQGASSASPASPRRTG
jgi:hypothetical protein